MVQKKYVCGDDNDEMMMKKTGKDKRREGERERERQRYRNIKAQCEHLRDLSDGYPEILFCIIFTSFLSKFVMVRMKINNMKISIPLRCKILHRPKYALIFYRDFFLKKNEGYENLHMNYLISQINSLYIYF